MAAKVILRGKLKAIHNVKKDFKSKVQLSTLRHWKKEDQTKLKQA